MIIALSIVFVLVYFYIIGYKHWPKIIILSVLCSAGCVKQISPVAERILPQRTDDLLFPCKSCGQPTQMNRAKCEDCSIRALKPRRLQALIV